MFFEITNLAKQFGETKVLKEISFSVAKGELISFVGPSGVGKTTLLRIIAGLEQDYTGQINFQAKNSLENPVVLVFQDYLLFPHLTIYENVAFGLKSRKMAKDKIQSKVTKILAQFQISEKSELYPKELSAGQKQRVAIARALVINPSILLLDEPFANLDKNLKTETADFIKIIQKEFNITTIAVMHDQEEAFRISDKIGVFLQGELKQFDTVEKVYNYPISFEVAKFLGEVNYILPESENQFICDEQFDFLKYSYFFRAESAKLTADSEGKFLISKIIFSGAKITYHLNENNNCIKINSLTNNFKIGDQVNIQIERVLREEK